MAKNEKKISISSLDKIIKENFSNKSMHEWYGVEVAVKHSLSFTETLEFVGSVVDSCFQPNGDYIPEVMDFAIKSNILSKYTNISLPDNLEHRYEIIYNSDVVDFVCQHINKTQLQEIVTASVRKVEHLCNTGIVEIRAKLNGLVDSFAEMQTQTEEMFSNVSADDIAKVMSAIGNNGEISEEKIVQAFLKHKSPETEKAS